MTKRFWESRLPVAAAVALLLTGLVGCTDVVYRDRAPFKAPPDAASGFLGYYDADAGQTTCGNCHVDHQGDWEKHAHSQAYADLVNSGEAQSFCYGCHTVSENGNAVDSSAGYNKTPDKAYYDVQCESCHGPGLNHVETPDASTPPLARADADTLGDPLNPNPKGTGTCAECHSGAHIPYAEQWRASRHGRANSHAYNGSSCMACHEGRSILKTWGVTSNYKERDDAVTDTVIAMGITCAVCHDPHGSGLNASLRFPIDDPTLEGNLCMKCHSRRFDPSTTSNSRGAHGVQGAILVGTAGWWPSGSDTTPQATTHGDPVANPRLCAGCHVNRFTVTDAGGNFQLQSVGHLFRPIPCLDPVTGEPLPGDQNSCAYNDTERWWGDPVAKTGCLQSGCHSSASTAAQALNASRSVVKILVDQIWVDVDGDEVVDFGTDGGYLAQVDPIEFTVNDNYLSPAEGALFNARMWGEHLSGQGEGGFGVHNPFLAQRQLATTITALQTAYAFPAPPAPIQALMRDGLAKATARGAAVPLRNR